MSHGADGGCPDTVDVALVWGIWCLQLMLLMMMNAWHKREKRKTWAIPFFFFFVILWPQEMTFTDICFWVSLHLAVWHANEKKVFSFSSTFSKECTTYKFDHVMLLNIAIQFHIVTQWFWSHLSAFEFEHVLSRAKLLHPLVFNCNQWVNEINPCMSRF